MKKLLLLFSVALVTVSLQAQVICFVQTPANLAGNYDFTWADPGGGDWSTPDLTDPANAITDTLMFVDDGTAEDSLGCNPLINDLTGKIAVIYRGSCEFGAKSLNAQNAGAVGVVIINNIAGAPIEMGGGAVGTSVTIPVVMITDIAGAALKSAINAGTVTMFIGSKQGFYGDDIGFQVSDVIMPRASAVPRTLAMDASEWSVELGAWLTNYGSNNQSSVTLSADIMYNGSSVYSQTSTPVSLNSDTFVFVSLPTFSQASYGKGLYEIQYTANISGTDEFPDDNTFSTNFLIGDSIFAYAPISDTSLLPITTASYRPSGNNGEFSACIHFRDPHASRMEAMGLSVTAVKGAGGDMTSEYLEVRAWQWDDQFTGIFDSTIVMSNLTEVAMGSYTYFGNDGDKRIYIPFDAKLSLMDNQRYVFCLTTYTADVYLGYNTEVDYAQTMNTYEQPVSIVHNPQSTGTNKWFWAGFGTEVTPSIGAVMHVITGVDPNRKLEGDISAYPNPTSGLITIPYEKLEGDAVLEIMDLTGRKVNGQQLHLDGSGQIRVDITDVSAGTYVFNLSLEDGTHRSFKVVVSR